MPIGSPLASKTSSHNNNNNITKMNNHNNNSSNNNNNNIKRGGGGTTTSTRLSSLAEDYCTSDDPVPAPYRARLQILFSQIEKEFELLYIENLSLQEKLHMITGGTNNGGSGTITGAYNSGSGGGGGPVVSSVGGTGNYGNSGIGICVSGGSHPGGGGGGGGNVGSNSGGIGSVINSTINNTGYRGDFCGAISDRYISPDFDTDIVSNKSLKSKLGGMAGGKVKASNKLRAQTSRIVSSFKAQSIVNPMTRDYMGHKDGVWQVSAKINQPIIGTASADHTASIWSIDNSRCLLQYQGHCGSVNSIKFHTNKDLVLTGSGDSTAHIWQAAVNWEQSSKRGGGGGGHSSEEELDDDDNLNEERDRIDVLRTPLCEFSGPGGHASVIVAADWITGGDQVITASWDRTAILWDVETREPLQPLTGHDHELTHVSAHQSQRLVVTASRDSTFRLWDFREPIPAVSVFQGHTESVTSTVFTRDDKVVSGSDDRTAKIWELRNMRSALTTIRTDSAINRLAVSTTGLIAIPHDNRHIRLFDLNGQRIARLPRTSRQGHRRMVSSVTWAEDGCNTTYNLFSCGFDRRVLGWSINLPKVE